MSHSISLFLYNIASSTATIQASVLELWAISILWLLWIMLQEKWENKYLLGIVFQHMSSMHCVFECLASVFWGTSLLLSKKGESIGIPPVKNEDPFSSACTSILDLVAFFMRLSNFGVRRYLTVVWFEISQVISYMEHIFIWFLYFFFEEDKGLYLEARLIWR